LKLTLILTGLKESNESIALTVKDRGLYKHPGPGNNRFMTVEGIGTQKTKATTTTTTTIIISQSQYIINNKIIIIIKKEERKGETYDYKSIIIIVVQHHHCLVLRLLPTDKARKELRLPR
jgi:hypothetical protein